MEKQLHYTTDDDDDKYPTLPMFAVDTRDTWKIHLHEVIDRVQIYTSIFMLKTHVFKFFVI